MMQLKPIDVFAKLYDLPPVVGNRLLAAGLPKVIPLASGLKIRVDDLDDERAVLSMPYTRRGSNHVGSMYLASLLLLAETTMASYVIRLCRPPTFRVLVKRSEADFLARATKRVRATCAPGGISEEREAIERFRTVTRGEKTEGWVTTELTHVHDGEPVCRVRFLVSVKHHAKG